MVEINFDKDQAITPYQEINELLFAFIDGILEVLPRKLSGIYLTGSLSYGDFNENSSDVDLTVILRKAFSKIELSRIRDFHFRLEEKYQKWSNRLECTYTPMDMLKNVLPPLEPRPWYCGFEKYLYAKAPYGNEWIINNYLLARSAIPLVGPDFKELIAPIEIIEVQKACIRDLIKEWEPKITDLSYLNDSHNQSYLILNLCRILYTVFQKSTGSKKVSAAWVKQEFGVPWKDLIISAEGWQYGKELTEHNQTIEFIKFTIDKVSGTDLFSELNEEVERLRFSFK